MKLVLFGFFRDALDIYDPLHGPLRHCEKYIYAPTLKHELKDSYVTSSCIHNKINNIKKLHLYDYTTVAPQHEHVIKQMEQSFGLPEFIGPKQLPVRTLSFFYNIRESLKLIPLGKMEDDEPIVLARADSNITRIHRETIDKLLVENDIICTEFRGTSGKVQPKLPGGGRSVVDHVFVFKKSAVKCFIDLYDDVQSYLYDRYSIKTDRGVCVKHDMIPSNNLRKTIPEAIFWYHFHVKGLKPIVDPTTQPKYLAIHYTFCSHKNKQHFLNEIVQKNTQNN